MTTQIAVTINGNYKRHVSSNNVDEYVSGKDSATPVSKTFQIDGNSSVSIGPEEADESTGETQSDANQNGGTASGGAVPIEEPGDDQSNPQRGPDETRDKDIDGEEGDEADEPDEGGEND